MGGGIFRREDWYSHLASSNRRIAEARERIENLKAHIRSLKHEGYGASRALALLRLCEDTLQLMNNNRANILERVRTYQLPVCDQHGLRCMTQTKCDPPEPEQAVYFKVTRRTHEAKTIPRYWEIGSHGRRDRVTQMIE